MADESTKDELVIMLAGEAVSQGSMKTYGWKNKKTGKQVNRLTHSNKAKLDPWREMVAVAAGQEVLTTPGWFKDDKEIGYVVQVIFYFAKPASAPKKRRLMTRRPDLDKLFRAIGDSLTKVVYPDDSQLIEIRARKEYVPPDTPPYVIIRVRKEYP